MLKNLTLSSCYGQLDLRIRAPNLLYLYIEVCERMRFSLIKTPRLTYFGLYYYSLHFLEEEEWNPTNNIVKVLMNFGSQLESFSFSFLGSHFKVSGFINPFKELSI